MLLPAPHFWGRLSNGGSSGLLQFHSPSVSISPLHCIEYGSQLSLSYQAPLSVPQFSGGPSNGGPFCVPQFHIVHLFPSVHYRVRKFIVLVIILSTALLDYHSSIVYVSISPSPSIEYGSQLLLSYQAPLSVPQLVGEHKQRRLLQRNGADSSMFQQGKEEQWKME
jgi:hypothetical protein